MAMLNFDASTVAPQTSYTPIPAGVYLASISASEVNATKNGSGQMLNLTFNVLDGQYAGRLVFGRINIQNASAEAQKIGQSQLSQLCHAAGVIRLQDTQQLHGRPIKIKVKVRLDSQYGDSNEVTSYEASGQAIPAPQQGFAPAPFAAAPTPPPFAAPPVAPAAAPWATA